MREIIHEPSQAQEHQGIAQPQTPVADVNGYAPLLYRAEDGVKFFSASAGKPYQPPNGSEGDMFEHMWCARCRHDEAHRAAWRDDDASDWPDGCPILSIVLCLDSDHPDYPREWQYSTAGQPLCTAFEPTAECSSPLTDTQQTSGKEG